MTTAPKLLIVRHGEGRGRLNDYWGSFWDHLRQNRPEIHDHLRFVETGQALPAMDDVRAVLFLLGDPLSQLYPDCYDHAARIRDIAAERGIPVHNDPDALSRFGRVTQHQSWRTADVPTPRVERVSSREDLYRLVSTVGPSFIFRSEHGHSQRDMILVRSDQDLDALLSAVPRPEGVFIEFVDSRAGYLERDPSSVYARYYHKRRSIVVGDTVRTNHLYFSASPIVGLASSTFNARFRVAEAITHPRTFLKELYWLRECLREDYRHWAGVSEFESVLVRATRALDLSFAAIDYSVFADGRIILWEANPYPGAVTYAKMPRLRRVPSRAKGIFDSLGAGLLRLLDGPSDRSTTGGS